MKTLAKLLDSWAEICLGVMLVVTAKLFWTESSIAHLASGTLIVLLSVVEGIKKAPTIIGAYKGIVNKQ